MSALEWFVFSIWMIIIVSFCYMMIKICKCISEFEEEQSKKKTLGIDVFPEQLYKCEECGHEINVAGWDKYENYTWCTKCKQRVYYKFIKYIKR